MEKDKFNDKKQLALIRAGNVFYNMKQYSPGTILSERDIRVFREMSEEIDKALKI